MWWIETKDQGTKPCIGFRDLLKDYILSFHFLLLSDWSEDNKIKTYVENRTASLTSSWITPSWPEKVKSRLDHTYNELLINVS